MKRFLTSVAGIALLAGPAAAENVFDLGEIKVSASPSEASAPSDTVSAADIDLLNRETVAKAASLIPGVNMTKSGARNEQMITVRGFDLRQVPLLVDGIPVYVPYDGYVDLGRFTTFDLSEIQVSKGWASVIDGPNAMGGVINLVSRKPVKPFEGEVSGGLEFGDGGFNGYHTTLALGSRQEDWWIQAIGSWLDHDRSHLSDDFTPGPAENGGHRDNSYRQDRKINLKMGYTPRDGDEYTLNYVRQDGEKGVPPYAGNDPAEMARFWQWPDWDKESLYWLSRTGFGETGYVKTRLFYDTFYNLLRAFDDATYTTQNRNSSFNSFYDDYTYGGSVEAGAEILPGNTTRMAFHYKHDVHREHDEGEPVQRMVDDTFSVGLENTFHVSPTFDLVGGVGYDWRDSIEAEELNAGGAVVDIPGLADDNSVNLQLAAVWRFTETGTARASVSSKSRFPTLKDRYSYRMGRALPNPSLQPERATNYEISASEQFFGNTRLDVAVFHSELDDVIQSVDLAPNLFQLQNVGSGSQNGFEVGVRTFALPDAELGASYTYVRRKIDDPTIKPTDTPRHNLVAWANYEAMEGLSLVPSIQYSSSRYVKTTGAKADGFFLANFAVRQAVTEWSDVEIGIENLFDEDYELAYGFPEPGRTYFLKTTMRF